MIIQHPLVAPQIRVCTLLLMLALCSGCATLSDRYGSARISLAVPQRSDVGIATLAVRSRGTGSSSSVTAPDTESSRSDSDWPAAGSAAPADRSPVPTTTGADLPVTVVQWDAPPGFVRIQTVRDAKADSNVSLQVPPIAPAPAPSQLVPQLVPDQVVLHRVANGGACRSCGEDHCLPPPVHTQQINELMERVASLEKLLEDSTASIVTLRKQLLDANQEVQTLSASVTKWQGEVERLEAAMQSQHEADINSLSRISEMLGSLVDAELVESETDEVTP